MGHTPARFCAYLILCAVACHPGDTGTSDVGTVTGGIDPHAATSTGDESTGAGPPGTSTTSGVPTTGADPMGPCAGQPSDEACPCVGAGDEFCNALDIFCRVEVHLDLGEVPGTDYCDVIFAYCTSPGVSNFSACELLESTCVQVAPTGDVADCDGARDACACDDLMWDHGTSTGSTGDTGDTEEDVTPVT